MGADGGGGESRSEKELEQLLEQVGGWDTYQFRLTALFLAFSMINTYVAYTPVLFLYVPDHRCKGYEGASTAPPSAVNATALLGNEAFMREVGGTEEANFLDGHLLLLAEEAAASAEEESKSQCYVKPPAAHNQSAADEAVLCPGGWDYNTTGFFSTAVSDMDWVCRDAWKGPFSQSIFYAGGIVGTLGFGVMADHVGRFPAFFYSSALIFLSGIATPFCTGFVSFCIARFVMGLTYDSALSLFYLLALEYVSVERRSFIGNFAMAIGFTAGGVYQPWLIRWLGDWKWFHHALFAQSAIVFITPWLMHESVLWLSSQGKVDKCKEILVDIAGINDKKLSPNFFDNFEKIAREEAAEEKRQEESSMIHLFQRPGMRKISLLMIITWVLISSLYDAHILNMANLNQSIYIAFTASSLMELPGSLAAIWGLEALGRRWSCCLGLLLSGISMAISGLVYDTMILLTIFATLGRFFITYAISAGMQFQFEVFPTQLRAQGSAVASVCVMVFQFFIPYIVYSSNHSECLPFLILAGLSFVGAFFSLLLPETTDVELPDTIEDAENLMRTTRFFHVPALAAFMERRRMSDNNNEGEEKKEKVGADADAVAKVESGEKSLEITRF